MILEFDIINILIALSTVANLLYGFLVYKRTQGSTSNSLFFLLAIAVSAWGISMIVFRSADSVLPALVAARWLYAAAAAIPTFFLLFALLYPQKKYTLRHRTTALVLIPYTFITLLVFLPNAFIQSVVINATGEHSIIFDQNLHVLYAFFVAGVFSTGYIALIRTYLKQKGLVRMQIVYILFGAMVPTLVGLFTNLILPIYGYFQWNWMGQISIAATTGLITYGILRHRIFNIRVIATELLIFVVWVIAFLRIVLSKDTAAVVFNTVAFGALILVGYWLIKSVTREVETREKLEKITHKLQETNDRLKELDRQKSEFLSIATHQLRGPLAGIRGHLSLIIDGSYGSIPERARDVITRVFTSSGLLAQTINDFLDVSRIEQGRMKYEMRDFDCDGLIAGIVEELRPVAEDRKLELSFENACEGVCTVHADYGKLRHIFFNLIDNAIKYTEKGWIKVHVTTSGSSVRTEISDSGIGIDPEEVDDLFQKFVRARDASGINVNGTGLGLFVARQMVEAHKGKVWVESEGKGKGSTFIVEVPRITPEEQRRAAAEARKQEKEDEEPKAL